jgi:hypothetical protein
MEPDVSPETVQEDSVLNAADSEVSVKSVELDADDETSSDSFIHRSSDSEIPPEVQAARDAWDEIERQQRELQQIAVEIGVGNVIVDRSYPITFFDARAYLLEQVKKSSVKYPPMVLESSRCMCWKPKTKPECERVWATLFKISKLNFDENDLTHHRILNSLHELITGVRTAPLRFGDHWTTIGFQGKDPILDLRAAGMLGLLLPLQLFAKFKKLGQKLARTSRLRDQEFPLMIVLISFVAATLEAAGTTALLRQSEKEREIWDDVGRFFAGMVVSILNIWEPQGCDFVHDFANFNEIANNAKSRPLLALKIGRSAEEKERSSAGGPQLTRDVEE